MKITKGKVILLVIVLYFTYFAFVNINKEKDINAYLLKNVTYVKDGKLDSKNEGKLVLVSGKIGYDSLVSFVELEDFSTIKISRKVEDYVKYYDEDEEKYSYEWQEREEPLKNSDGDYLKTLLSEEKVSNVNIGDYTLDSHGLDLIPADRYYSGQESIGDLTTKGISYERDPWEEDLVEGDMKLTYKYYDLEKNPYISVLAIQKGNSFVPYKADKKTQVYHLFVGKIDSEKKLSKQLDKNVKRTTKGKFLFIAMILGIGVFFIVDSKK